ncbi:hypothetical protein PJO24_004563 [Salmonella enterica]|nr:hypothetical protein [Salmonella enterica]
MKEPLRNIGEKVHITAQNARREKYPGEGNVPEKIISNSRKIPEATGNMGSTVSSETVGAGFQKFINDKTKDGK